MWSEIVLTITLFFLYWFFITTKPPANFPPGPRFPLPFIGHALMVGKSFTDFYEKMRKKYGQAFSFNFGPFRTVIVSDYELIKEVGASPDIVYRPQTYLLGELRGGTVVINGVKSIGGVVFGIGPSWEEQRRFTLHNLRNLGFGKVHMEDLLMEEVTKLCQYLETFNGAAISVKQYMNMAVVNSLWHIVAGSKLDYGDEKLKKVVDHVNDITGQRGGPITMALFFYKPLAQMVLKLGMIKSVSAFNNLRTFMSSVIEEHKMTFQEDNLRDFIDIYLKEANYQKEQQNFKSSFVGHFGEINFLNVLMDLFMAGSETSSNILNHAMLLLIKNPSAMRKLQTELDQVTGRARLPTYADRTQTPYTEAVITEIMRVANIAPVAVHLASKDTTIGNGKYFIPKDTRVCMNIGHLMTSPDNFPDPTNFDPTRHLNDKGQYDPSPVILPFGTGRRRCLGETLAKMNVYMFVAGLASHFDFKKEHESEDIKTGAVNEGRLVDSIAPVTMRFVPRS